MATYMGRLVNLLRKTPIYVPLWQREIPRYPLHWKGDPQLRIHMPLFWVRPVKPRQLIPPNRVTFEVHPQMTSGDVKQYLEKIYELPIAHVHTALVEGRTERRSQFIKGIHIEKEIDPDTDQSFITGLRPDSRLAFVTLAEGETFVWPDIEVKLTPKERKEDKKRMKLEKDDNLSRRKLGQTQDIPPWFR